MPTYIGLRKTSLVDYPGRVAAVLFLPGCNLRCPWCHNRELISDDASAESDGRVALDTALAVVRKRKTVIGGVVISGGEPLLRADIGNLIASIKREGVAVKLDTNG